jgi:hypothetical protein
MARVRCVPGTLTGSLTPGKYATSSSSIATSRPSRAEILGTRDRNVYWGTCGVQRSRLRPELTRDRHGSPSAGSGPRLIDRRRPDGSRRNASCACARFSSACRFFGLVVYVFHTLDRAQRNPACESSRGGLLTWIYARADDRLALQQPLGSAAANRPHPDTCTAGCSDRCWPGSEFSTMG